MEITATPFDAAAVVAVDFLQHDIYHSLPAHGNVLLHLHNVVFHIQGSHEPFVDNTINLKYFALIKGNSQSFAIALEFMF